MALWYRSAPGKMLNKEIDWDSDTIKATLHTSTYAPNRATHDYVDDLTNELAAGGGYSTGGVTAGTKTVVTTEANSWGTVHTVSTVFTVDYVVRPSSGNGFLYRCAVAGTSASSAPTWPTVIGQTVTDGTVTWECAGRAIAVIDCADFVWSTATFTAARYCVISDRQTGVNSTSPLIGLIDFGTDKAGGGGNFTVQLDAQGLLHSFIA